MAEQANQADPMAAASAADKRVLHTFTFPDKSRTFESDPRTIALVEITLAEEEQAFKVAMSNKSDVGSELLKRAIVEVDGKRLGWASGERERFLEGCSPKIRALLSLAYKSLHEPSKEDETAFLASKGAKAR